MSTSSSSLKTSTVLIASAGAVITGILGYAIYFDHRRRSDPEFRKALKKEARRVARSAKEDAEAQGAQQRQGIKAAAARIRQEDLPTDNESREMLFMQEISKAEGLSTDDAQQVESASSFYRALKVYPSPRDLIPIYNKTIPKPVLDILAEMIALDPALDVSITGSQSGSGAGSDRGIDD